MRQARHSISLWFKRPNMALDGRMTVHSLFSRLRKNLGSGVGTSASLRLGWGEVLLLPPPPSALFSPPEVLRVERLRECVLSESGLVQRRRFGVVAVITGEMEVSLWAECPSVDWGVDGFRPGLGERSPRDLTHDHQLQPIRTSICTRFLYSDD